MEKKAIFVNSKKVSKQSRVTVGYASLLYQQKHDVKYVVAPSATAFAAFIDKEPSKVRRAAKEGLWYDNFKMSYSWSATLEDAKKSFIKSGYEIVEIELEV